MVQKRTDPTGTMYLECSDAKLETGNYADGPEDHSINERIVGDVAIHR